MNSYLEAIDKVLSTGKMLTYGNETRRLTTFVHDFSYDLSGGYIPMVTTRKISWTVLTAELCWFLNGSTNVADLHKYGVHIWDANARENGELGPIYGAQWRKFNGGVVDQIARAVNILLSNPTSTRNIVTAWNPAQLYLMALPPCHFQFQLLSDGTNLSLSMTQRSGDLALGIPYNITSYAVLLNLFCNVTGLLPGMLHIRVNNLHIYEEHIAGMQEQLTRTPYGFPSMSIDEALPIDLKGLNPGMFSLHGYKHHPHIEYKLIT